MPAARGLTAAQLKYLAAFFMVVDHIGMLFLPMAPFFPTDSLWFYSFRYLGRLAFPIFAFFAAEGCRKTSNYSRHLLRLGLFGAVTHVVAYVATGGTSGSVIATFFLAAAAIGFCRTVWAEGYAWTDFCCWPSCCMWTMAGWACLRSWRYMPQEKAAGGRFWP